MSNEVEDILVVGIGNRFRGDDAIGCLIADRLKAQSNLPTTVKIIEHTGEPASLMDAWQGYGSVILLDAVFSNHQTGTIHSFNLTEETLPASFAKPTTHAVGVAEAVEFARVLGKLPDKIFFYGIEGGNYDSGEHISEAVQKAADELFTQLNSQLKETSHA